MTAVAAQVDVLEQRILLTCTTVDDPACDDATHTAADNTTGDPTDDAVGNTAGDPADDTAGDGGATDPANADPANEGLTDPTDGETGGAGGTTTASSPWAADFAATAQGAADQTALDTFTTAKLAADADLTTANGVAAAVYDAALQAANVTLEAADLAAQAAYVIGAQSIAATTALDVATLPLDATADKLALDAARDWLTVVNPAASTALTTTLANARTYAQSLIPDLQTYANTLATNALTTTNSLIPVAVTHDNVLFANLVQWVTTMTPEVVTLADTKLDNAQTWTVTDTGNFLTLRNAQIDSALVVKTASTVAYTAYVGDLVAAIVNWASITPGTQTDGSSESPEAGSLEETGKIETQADELPGNGNGDESGTGSETGTVLSIDDLLKKYDKYFDTHNNGSLAGTPVTPYGDGLHIAIWGEPDNPKFKDYAAEEGFRRMDLFPNEVRPLTSSLPNGSVSHFSIRNSPAKDITAKEITRLAKAGAIVSITSSK